MTALGEGKRLTVEIRNGDIGGQAEWTIESLEAHVIGTGKPGGDRLRPSASRFAQDLNARGPLDGLDDAKKLRRAKRAVVLHKARRKIQHAEGSRGRLKSGLQNIGVLEIGLLTGLPVACSHDELSTVGIEQGGEH